MGLQEDLVKAKTIIDIIQGQSSNSKVCIRNGGYIDKESRPLKICCNTSENANVVLKKYVHMCTPFFTV